MKNKKELLRQRGGKSVTDSKMSMRKCWEVTERAEGLRSWKFIQTEHATGGCKPWGSRRQAWEGAGDGSVNYVSQTFSEPEKIPGFFLGSFSELNIPKYTKIFGYLVIFTKHNDCSLWSLWGFSKFSKRCYESLSRVWVCFPLFEFSCWGEMLSRCSSYLLAMLILR